MIELIYLASIGINLAFIFVNFVCLKRNITVANPEIKAKMGEKNERFLIPREADRKLIFQSDKRKEIVTRP